MRKSVLTGAIALSLLSLNVHALSVGKMNIESYLGEPLDISIDVKSVSKSELSTLEVSLASRQLFTQAGIQYPENADSIKVELDSSKANDTRILVTSRNSITDPFVHLLLRISWSGGNMLREYTALIDPADYKTQAIAKAASPATRLGVVRTPAAAPKSTVVAAAGESAEPGYHPAVKAGESLSAIASLYRPADVSAQQSWIAFFNLNPKAFPGGNLNNLSKGARLQIPTAEQMRAISRDDARNQVKNLTRPLTPASAKPAPAKMAEKTPEAAPAQVTPVAQPKAAPTLVVGGSAGVVGGSAGVAGGSAGGNDAAAQMPASTGAANAQNLSITDLQGYDQITAVMADINQELQGSREQNNQVQQALATTRGENRVLNDRLSQLEVQLGKMNQLLELQSQALQNLSANRFAGAPADTATAQPEVQPAPVAVAPAAQPLEPQPIEQPQPVAIQPVAEPADTVGDSDTPEEEKTYYEQLLGSAISEAPDEDRQYIEAIEKQSSTAIGKPDAMPVTDEMERAATAKPDMPEVPVDQQAAAMMDDVRASLQNLRTSTTGSPAADSPATAGTEQQPVDLKISPQDTAYVAALNERELSEIDRLEQELELRKQAVRDASEAAAAAQTAEQAARDAAPAVTRVAAPEQGFMATLKGLVSGLMDGISSLLGGISSDIWKLLGGIGAGLLGLMLVLGLRKNRRDADTGNNEILPGSDMSSVNEDIDELSDFMMPNASDSSIEADAELHGSSMFDLSDESFMASEAIQDDSSLFSMDDDNSDMDSLGDMDSIGHQQSALAAVDVDPVAEAEVYLAYDRQEQAIEVLEQALQQNPNQGGVAVKLLGLYQAADNKQAFSDLFSASSGQIDDDAEWDSIKRMAKDFVPEHELLADDFDSSIPVLMDEMSDAGGDDLAISDEEDLFRAAAENLDKLDAESTEEFNKAQGNEGGISLSLADESDDEEAFAALSSSSLELDEELDSAMQEVNQHDPDTALALAKAYIELGENDIAKDFLNDAINSGSDETKAEAKAALAAMG